MSIKIISAHAIFTENALVMSQRLNIPLEKDFAPKPGDLYLVFGAHEIAPTLWMVQKQMNNQFGYIILNTEQIKSKAWCNKYYIDLCRDNPVFQYSTFLSNEIRDKFKINPYSFFIFEFLGFKKEDLEITEEYDITFIGAKSEKREKLIEEIKATFPDKKIYVDFEYKNNTPVDLSRILHSSKIVLNIPFYEDNALETHRINKALSCGCKVVSLFSGDDDANDFYKDYIWFTSNIVKTLKDEALLSQPKKTYEELIQIMNPKTVPHNAHTIKTIHTKLLSKVNVDEKKAD